MNGEYLMDMACGHFDQFHQMLYTGELDMEAVQELYDETLIDEKQYKFAKEYLKGE